MYRKLTFSLLVLAFVGIASCNKATSVEQSSNGLLGVWNLVNIQVQSNTTTEVSVAGADVKTVAETDYTTTNNAGTVTFTPDSIIAQGISYYDSTGSTVKYYTNGVLLNTTTVPFVSNIPPTNSSTKYQMIRTDSLFCPAGTIFSGGSSGLPAIPAGFKLAFSGNTLVMTTPINQTIPQVISGVPGTLTIQVLAAITLRKQ